MRRNIFYTGLICRENKFKKKLKDIKEKLVYMYRVNKVQFFVLGNKNV